MTPTYGTIDRDYAMRLLGCLPEKDGPVLMVNFMRYRPRALYEDGTDHGLSGQEADEAYAPLKILADIGAVVVFFGDVEAGGSWHRVGIVRYPTRQSFMQMQTRSDFQEAHVHKAAGMDHTIVCGCVPLGIRARHGGTKSRVAFELVTAEAKLTIEGAAPLRVDGTILGDGRRFASLGVAWIDDDVIAPAPSADRVVAVVRPSIDRLWGELSMAGPAQ